MDDQEDIQFQFRFDTKGIMFTIVLKIYIGLCLGAYLAAGAPKNATSTTTTTPKPLLDQEPSDTVNYDSTLQLLRHGESISNSKSFSYSKSAGHGDYESRNPGYDKGRYVEDQNIRYEKDTNQDEGYYKSNDGGNYQQTAHEQPLHQDAYSGSYEDQYHQREHSYEEPQQKGSPYPYQEQNVEEQDPYGHQDYPKGGPYESSNGKNYNDAQPPFLQYAYEVSHDRGQASYEPSSGSGSGDKSGYGPTDAKVYSQKEPEQEYYPVHKPTSYANQNIYKGDKFITEERKQDNYFPTIPTEAGYISNNQKEPDYLQSPPNSPSYSKQAGYSHRSPEPKALIPFLPEDSIKEPPKSLSYSKQEGYLPISHEPQAFQPVLSKNKPSGYPDSDRVSILIKHLGHKSSANSQYGNKERHGFLLLPVHDKVHDKLKQLGGNYGEEYKQVAYKEDKESGPYQNHRPVIEKEIYVQPKDARYSVSTKESSYGSTSSKGTEYVEPQAKSIQRPQIYVSSKPTLSHGDYAPVRYESLKVLAYGGGRPSSKEEIVYSSKSVSGYKVPESKSAHSGGSLVYGGNHGNGATSYASSAKFEPLYGKSQAYASSYDAHRSVPIKILQPSHYSSLPHQSEYSGVSGLHSQINIAKKAVPQTTHVLSTHQYKSHGTRLSPSYEYPKSETSSHGGRSYAVILQKPKEHEIVGLRPSLHTARGRVSAKTLVEGFGLHDYETLLAKQKAPSVGKLYYDLHEFPVRHDYAEVRADKSYSAITPVH